MQPTVLAATLTVLTLAATWAFAEGHETPGADQTTDRPELVTHVSPERADKLKRKAKKALKFVHAQGRYMDHGIVTINTDALQRLDPVPEKPEKGTDDPALALSFEMTFTPVEGETYILKNAKNFKTEFFGNPMTMWQGVLESTDGEVLGDYMLSDMNGKFDVSGFGFESGEFGWGFRDIEGEPETTVVRMLKPEK